MNQTDVTVFALHAATELGQKVADKLGIALSGHEERDFEDGEHKSRPLVNVRGKDVFVIQSLYGDDKHSPNDKLCRLLFFLGGLRDAAAERITAIVPYLCYARKDQKTKPRDPVTTRYIAALFEAVGVDRVVTLDVHNLSAFQNAFRCRTDHLEARGLFVDYFSSLLKESQVVVVSPDVGGVKRAERFRQALSHRLNQLVSSAFMNKQRSEGVVSGQTLAGGVKGKHAIIIDDLISTGTTIARAARVCRDQGATKVYAAASHGIFVGNANRVLAESGLEKLAITDTIPPFRLEPSFVKDKLVILDTASLIAEAIDRIHSGGSLVGLLNR